MESHIRMKWQQHWLYNILIQHQLVIFRIQDPPCMLLFHKTTFVCKHYLAWGQRLVNMAASPLEVYTLLAVLYTQVDFINWYYFYIPPLFTEVVSYFLHHVLIYIRSSSYHLHCFIPAAICCQIFSFFWPNFFLFVSSFTIIYFIPCSILSFTYLALSSYHHLHIWFYPLTIIQMPLALFELSS